MILCCTVEIGSTISNLFGGGKKEDAKGGADEQQKEDIPSEVRDFFLLVCWVWAVGLFSTGF